MADMSIAHFGTTLIESPPAADADQASIPMTGDLARTDQFLRMLGAEIYLRNMYPGVGRQYIYKRGSLSDSDYFEKDTFTSYIAEPVPGLDKPRAGDTIFRLPHKAPQDVVQALADADLIVPISSFDAFLAGDADTLLFLGPDHQQYEICASLPQRHQNHRIYIWTSKQDLEDHQTGYAQDFDLHFETTEDFYGLGTAHLMVRTDPGITIALVTTNEGDVAPKHSFDIFKDAGYSHFRLGAPDKKRVLQKSQEAFPDGGGPVSYVHFKDAYLELVQVGTEEI